MWFLLVQLPAGYCCDYDNQMNQGYYQGDGAQICLMMTRFGHVEKMAMTNIPAEIPATWDSLKGSLSSVNVNVIFPNRVIAGSNSLYK